MLSLLVSYSIEIFNVFPKLCAIFCKKAKEGL